MKLLDVSKCHEDSPEFRNSLEKMEEGMQQLERQMKKICALCEEREALAQKDRQLYNELISEFDFFLKHEVDSEEPSIASLTEVMTTGLRQLVDNRERMFEQIKLGMLHPLHHFLDQELEQVKASQKTYHKVKMEALHVVEKLSQLSLQLFDSRYALHKGACAYAMDLNHLHAKKTPDFLQKLVDFMTSQLSYFHLGQVTIDDVRPYMENTYTIMEKLRSKASLQDAQQRTQTTSLLGEVLTMRAKNLANFHTHDLHFNSDTAKSTVMRHLKEHHSSMAVEEKELENFDEKPPTNPSKLTKSGYLWYAETKTFGTHWTRLFFCIKKGMLVSAESMAKVRVPISLNLNLCSAKPAQVADTERNFCFKVISPIRSLLLQAESSRDMQQWMEVLQNAIAHALHSPSTPEREQFSASFPLPTSSTSSSASASAPSTTSPAPTSTSPIPPVRRKTKSKVNVTKELYAVAGNEVCADCGNSKPKWASINLGVLVCIECSGVHRSLGVYVSQVRSLTLDTLKPEWLKKLKEFGNKSSNAIYEKNLPEDFDREVVRTEERRQEFITEKYIDLKYALEEERERIRRERQEARAESVRRSTKLISQSSTTAVEAQKPEAAVSSSRGAAARGQGSAARGQGSAARGQGSAARGQGSVTRSNSVGNSLLSSLKSDGSKQSNRKESPLLSKRKGREKKEKKEKNGGRKSHRESSAEGRGGGGERGEGEPGEEGGGKEGVKGGEVLADDSSATVTDGK